MSNYFDQLFIFLWSFFTVPTMTAEIIDDGVYIMLLLLQSEFRGTWCRLHFNIQWKGSHVLSVIHTHTHTRLTALFSGTTQVSRYQKGKTNLDFTEARDSEWQWIQLGHMQVCTSLQRDNHASTPPLSFLQAGCPSCRPANSVKALKATVCDKTVEIAMIILLTSSRLQIFQFLNCWVVRWPFVQNNAGYFTGQCNDTFAIF